MQSYFDKSRTARNKTKCYVALTKLDLAYLNSFLQLSKSCFPFKSLKNMIERTTERSQKGIKFSNG